MGYQDTLCFTIKLCHDRSKLPEVKGPAVAYKSLDICNSRDTSSLEKTKRKLAQMNISENQVFFKKKTKLTFIETDLNQSNQNPPVAIPMIRKSLSMLVFT